MCIFIKPVREVKETRILVSPTKKNRVLVIYENYVGIDKGTGKANNSKITELEAKQQNERTSNAMILPAPLSAETNEINLFDLSKGKFDFKNCEKCFPVVKKLMQPQQQSRHCKSSQMSIPVVSVGAYNVSIAKSINDLSMIDNSVFKLPENVAELLSTHYSKGFGFVVCIFDSSKGIDPHPMGYECDRDQNDGMFVPCLHEHGKGDEDAHFDHKIYSVNSGHMAGESVDECNESASKLDKKLWTVKKAELTPESLFEDGLFSETIGEIHSFRRLIMKGKFPNKDLFFSVVA